MSFLNEKCCDKATQANDELKSTCDSYVYGTNFDCFLYVVDSFSRLYRVDQTTGASSLIGPVGFGGVTDIAWDGSALYGITGNSLISINTTTGAGTLIGNHNTGSNALESDATGQLYMMGGNNIYLLNKVTAVATLIGPMGAGFFSSGDLAFDSAGNLFGSFTNGNLGRINTGTGAASNIGPFGFNPVWGLDFCGPILYGITAGGDLITVDVNTGAGTLVANTGINNVYGMTSVETRAEIPCDRAELPQLEPVFTVTYGEDPSDLIETKDVQCLCITACNPYSNVHLCDVTILVTEVFDPNGDPVDPDKFLLKPTKMVCFGDLGPCDQTQSGCACAHDSCASRELLLVTRGADPGKYTVKFEYCYNVKWGTGNSFAYELEVVQ